MTVKERLEELERQYKALEHEIAEALGQSSVDDLKVKYSKRRKLIQKLNRALTALSFGRVLASVRIVCTTPTSIRQVQTLWQ